jgi:hypothetical protein
MGDVGIHCRRSAEEPGRRAGVLRGDGYAIMALLASSMASAWLEVAARGTVVNAVT